MRQRRVYIFEKQKQKTLKLKDLLQIRTRTEQQKRMYDTVRNANAWPWGGPVVVIVRSLYCFGQIKQKLKFASDSWWRWKCFQRDQDWPQVPDF